VPQITEGNLTFDFPNGWLAEKYDGWSFYVGGFQQVCGGAKAVDILAVNSVTCCWLIEIKDYRLGCQTTALNLAEAVAQKVRDTLAGLATARVRATGIEQQSADAGLKCADFRAVLHLEQPATTSTLFPSPINRANVLQRLRQLIKAIDPNPQVVDMNDLQSLPWTVT
jgi:hypothetical protein